MWPARPTVRRMGRVYLFADETGNFDFSSSPGASRYFGVGTLRLTEPSVDALRTELHRVRTELAWERHALDRPLHASSDPRPIRRRVFDVLRAAQTQFDTTLIPKATVPSVWARPLDRELALYRAAWETHLSRLLPLGCAPGDDLLVIAAQIGTKRRRALFRRSVEEAVHAAMPELGAPRVAFWPASSDPGLWATDYLLWAAARRWEQSAEVVDKERRTPAD